MDNAMRSLQRAVRQAVFDLRRKMTTSTECLKPNADVSAMTTCCIQHAVE
jgi:hypothetical protein